MSGNWFEVVGNSYVAIYNTAVNVEEFPMLSKNDSRPFHFLREGDSFDLTKRILIKKERE